jgi:hypothetical protein
MSDEQISILDTPWETVDKLKRLEARLINTVECIEAKYEALILAFERHLEQHEKESPE